ncbi:hypothetical protein WDW37_08165 [Bdellovibrionota bacterium FG-1]
MKNRKNMRNQKHKRTQVLARISGKYDWVHLRNVRKSGKDSRPFYDGKYTIWSQEFVKLREGFYTQNLEVGTWRNWDSKGRPKWLIRFDPAGWEVTAAEKQSDNSTWVSAYEPKGECEQGQFLRSLTVLDSSKKVVKFTEMMQCNVNCSMKNDPRHDQRDQMLQCPSEVIEFYPNGKKKSTIEYEVAANVLMWRRPYGKIVRKVDFDENEKQVSVQQADSSGALPE